MKTSLWSRLVIGITILLISLLPFVSMAQPMAKGYVITPSHAETAANYFSRLAPKISAGTTMAGMQTVGGLLTVCFTGSATGCVDVVHPSVAGAHYQVVGDLGIMPSKKTPLAPDHLKRLLAAVATNPFVLWTPVKEPVVADPQQGLIELTRQRMLAMDGITAERMMDILAAMGGAEEELVVLSILAKATGGNPEAALQNAKKAMENADFSAYTKRSIAMEQGRTLLLMGRFKEGIATLNALAARSEKPPIDTCEVILETAELLAVQKFKERREQLLSFAEKNTQCSGITAALGMALVDSGVLSLGVEKLKAALDKQPGLEPAIGPFVSGMRRLNRHQEVLPYLERFYDAKPENKTAVVTLYATTCSYIDDFEWIHDHLQARLKTRPDDPLATVALLVMYYYTTRFEQAIAIADKARALAPNNDRVYVYGGMSRYNLGDMDGARKWLWDAPDQPGRDPDIYFCRALIEYHEGNQAVAVANMERYVAHPVSPDEFMEKPMIARKMLQAMRDGGPLEHFLPHGESSGYNNTLVAGIVVLILLLLLAGLIFGRAIAKRKAQAKILSLLVGMGLGLMLSTNASAAMSAETLLGDAGPIHGYTLQKAESSPESISYHFSNEAGEAVTVVLQASDANSPAFGRTERFNVYYKTSDSTKGATSSSVNLLMQVVLERVKTNDDGSIVLQQNTAIPTPVQEKKSLPPPPVKDPLIWGVLVTTETVIASFFS